MEKNLDKKLYNDYLNGEKLTFVYIYNKYKNRIKHLIFNIVKDYQKSEDLTQETFIYVMQNKMKENSSFKYYIYSEKSYFNSYTKLQKRNGNYGVIYSWIGEDENSGIPFIIIQDS